MEPPDGQGMALLRRWRRAGLSLPVIVITARTALQDRLDGLDGGADDYVLKPFDVPELLSRLHAVLRRSARQASERWVLGELVIEPRRHAVQRNGVLLDVSPREFQLLLELARELVGIARDGLGRVAPRELVLLPAVEEVAATGRAPAERVREAFARGNPLKALVDLAMTSDAPACG